MEQEQITENQHFVPKFYLKQFAKEGQVQIFNLRTKQIWKPRPYTSVCYEKFFYADKTGVQDEISQGFEWVFGQIEDRFAKALPGIIERAAGQQLTRADLYELAEFMSLQWVRVLHFRKRVQKVESELWNRLLKKLGSLGSLHDWAAAEGMLDEHIDQMERLLQSGRFKIRITDNHSHLVVISKDIVSQRRLLLAKRWLIFFSDRPRHFITSDNPVVEVWPTPPPKIDSFGANPMDRGHLFALTANVLVVIWRPSDMNRQQQPADRLSYHAATGEEVLMFNRVLASDAHRFAYASRTDEFKHFLK